MEKPRLRNFKARESEAVEEEINITFATGFKTIPFPGKLYQLSFACISSHAPHSPAIAMKCREMYIMTEDKSGEVISAPENNGSEADGSLVSFRGSEGN